jgi:hypothetical protein
VTELRDSRDEQYRDLSVSEMKARPRHYQSSNLTVMVLCIGVCQMPNLAGAQRAGNDLLFDTQQFRTNALTTVDRGTGVSAAAFVEPVREGQEAAPSITFSAFLPILYNSNAQSASSGRESSAEVTPEIRLGWSQSLAGAPVTFSGLVDLASDRYPSSSDANGDSAAGTFRAQYVTGGDDQECEPFFQYSPHLSFEPTWRSRIGTTHDLAIGFDKAFNFESDFSLIRRPKQDTSRIAEWSLGFTGAVKRRLSDTNHDAWIASAAPSLTWNHLNSDATAAQWNASIELDVTQKWGDTQAGTSRRDTLVGPVVTIEYMPPFRWFNGTNDLERDQRRKRLGRPRVDFQLSFVNDHASDGGRGFHQWTVGPSLKASWNF